MTNNDNDDNIYYIGDSKYYKRGNALGAESIYKQFTYARNVIQWNLDLFNDGKKEDQAGHIKLRDDATEGYNIIPNFFISANQNELRAADDIHLIDSEKPEGQRRQEYYLSRQYDNRLFDRDTFLLAHYDVNFLFVVSLYGRNNSSSKAAWRNRVRQMFRKEIQKMLEKNFDFYAMTAHANVHAEEYIKENFQSVLGKVFHPFENREGSDQQYFSLALRKPEKEYEYYKNVKHDAVHAEEARKKIADENEQVMFELKQAFYVAPCSLGKDPRTLTEDVMPIVEPRPHNEIPKQFLTMHYLENYAETTILVGIVNGLDHLHWIFSRKGGKRDDAYNVRLGKDVHGGVVKSRDYVKHAKFVVLYMDGENKVYKAFRVKNTGELSRDQMLKQGYTNPRHDRYFCYFFDEEITLGEFDINGIIQAEKSKSAGYDKGMPIFLKGSEMIKYRK